MQTKENLFSFIDSQKEQYLELGDFIHSNPELGNEEFLAKQSIVSHLENLDFEISEVSNLPTAFVASYKSDVHSSNSKVIAMLCEYDALEGLGHACAHNLQPPSTLLAAAAICKGLQNYDFELKIIGTPAEETTSAKIPMVHQGIFDDLDLALMMHGGDRTTVDGRSLAATNLKVTFKGTASHAAVAPEKGRSALDGVIQTFNNIEYLREHVRSDVRMHGIISDGGVKPNIVPEKASAEFSIRAKSREYLNSVLERVHNIIKGAALSTETEYEIIETKSLESKLNVQTLNDVMLENASLANADNITPPRKNTGSTDFSIVTHRVPGACIRMSFVPFGTPNHTKDWEVAAKSSEGHKAIVNAAKVLAGTIFDYLDDESLQVAISTEHKEAKLKTKVED